MSVLVAIPDRDRLEVVLMQRDGLGWIVGVGRMAGGRVEREHSGHLLERDARATALGLADRLDLLVFQSAAQRG